MSIKKEPYARLADGTQVFAYTLAGAADISARILDFGGTIVNLWVPDKCGVVADVVAAYENFDSYIGGDYLGALVGRYGNRIAEGRFTLDGKEYVLATNNGKNHLHGGNVGFSWRMWQAEAKDSDEPELILSYVSPDGEEGYPGTLCVKVTYKLCSDNALSIHYVATTDKKTLVSLTNHAYFNLAGHKRQSILEHKLTLDADAFLVTDDALIPTGEIRAVDGTPFDFREGKRIGDGVASDYEPIKIAGGYDHCLCFTDRGESGVSLRGELCDTESGRAMEIYTDAPAVQIYSACVLTNQKHPLKDGLPQTKWSYVCLETEKMPDSIHHDNFTNVILDVGETYDTTTVYKFKAK